MNLKLVIIIRQENQHRSSHLQITEQSSYQQKILLDNMQILCLDSQFILTTERCQVSQCSVFPRCFSSEYNPPLLSLKSVV